MGSPETVALRSQAVRHLRSRREQVLRLIGADIAAIPGHEVDGAERLLVALESEITERTGDLIAYVESLVDATAASPDLISGIQRSIARLRQILRDFSSIGLEDLWHEARDCIDMAAMRSLANYRYQTDDRYLRMLQSTEEVSRALNRESFRNCLANILPLMNIRRSAISRFTDERQEQLELVVALVDKELKEDTGERFPARQLAPLTREPCDGRSTSLVLPLVQDDKPLGVAVFEYGGDATGYLMVRTQISAALSSILLHQEMIEKSTQHERSVQERIATTKRMEALSLLAGGVAHDLNNALGPLVALPDIILDDLEVALAGGNASELRKDVETVKVAALRAAQTIKDLLTLGRQGRTAKELVDLRKTVEGCLSTDLLRMVKTTTSDVTLRVEKPGEALVVHASEPHLVRAITNLVHNAIEAISSSGKVVIKLSAVRLDAPLHGFETIEAGNYVVVAVSDNGRGMTSQDLHRVFEPFFTKKRTSEHTGSGLGLAIVHGVVKEHEGFIDVTTEPGMGTTFSLYFPRAEAQLAENVRARTPVPRGRGRVLIVDDEPVQLRTGRRVLSRLGYQVDTLESGRQAHECFLRAAESGESPYDLVILDMILNEDLDGLERFEQIRELFPTQRAIVVSGHAPTERAEAAFERGLTWLAKPYTADGMAKAVQAALEERPSATMRVSCSISLTSPEK